APFEPKIFGTPTWMKRKTARPRRSHLVMLPRSMNPFGRTALAGLLQAAVSGLVVWEKSGVGPGRAAPCAVRSFFWSRTEGPGLSAPPGLGVGLGGGGGSYPPGWNGWHLHRRLTESKVPRRAPWPSRQATAYREHEGSNRHAGPKTATSRRDSVS